MMLRFFPAPVRLTSSVIHRIIPFCLILYYLMGKKTTLLSQEKSTRKVRVLFVCLGNICRSPMAEGVFLHKVRQAGLETWIETDSAGTGHWHEGEPPHPETRRILALNQIRYDHRARVLTASDLERFDYILTMDEDNYRDVQKRGDARAKIARLMDFAPQTGASS